MEAITYIKTINLKKSFDKLNIINKSLDKLKKKEEKERIVDISSIENKLENELFSV